MQTLSDAIDELGREYIGGMFDWLAEKNPMAMRQINALGDKVNAQILAGDMIPAGHTIKIWKQTILFWNSNYKKLKGAK